MAARILGAHQAKVRSWIQGYSNSGATSIIHPQLPRFAEHKLALGFLDLIDSKFVHHFTTLGYSPQTIRKVADRLRERHKVDHPFAMQKRFRADGRFIFEEIVEDDKEKQLLNLMNDNFELTGVVEQSLFDDILYIEDMAHQWTPIHKYQNVIINPHHAFGRPVVDEYFVPTDVLARAYLNEGGLDEAAEEFELPPELVREAVAFEHELAERTIH
jgi:uncharacterized protein (DUF433 family)